MTDPCVANGVNFLRQDVRVLNEQFNAIIDVNEPCCSVDNQTITGSGTSSNPLTLSRGVFAPGTQSGFPRDTIIGVNPANPNALTSFSVEVPSSSSGYGIVMGLGNSYPDGNASGGAILGGESNEIIAGADYAVVTGGEGNTAGSAYDFIGGGQNNVTMNDHSSIVGGEQNTTEASYAFIGGGARNQIGANSDLSFIGGGTGNTITAGSSGCGILGGRTNIITGSTNSFIVGSSEFVSNTITGSSGSVIIGGGVNTISGSNEGFIIGGGNSVTNGGIAIGTGNIVTDGFAMGVSCQTTGIAQASVAMGQQCTATGFASFALGSEADAKDTGSFVWSDNLVGFDTPVSSFGTNTFSARARGGVRFYTTGDQLTYAELTSGSGMWTAVSDKNKKENISKVSNKNILEKLSKVPVYRYNYKTQQPDIQHIGVMGQDFYKQFGLGEKDTHIYAVDEAGVCIAAIQELCKQNQELRAEVEALKLRVT